MGAQNESILRPCFLDKKYEILSVLDSSFSEEKANGNIMKEKFVILKEEINKILLSEHCSEQLYQRTQSPCYSRFNHLLYT